MGENLIGVTLVRERPMSLGLVQRQGDLLDDVTRFCDESLPEGSVFRFLHRERDRLFPDEMFADLFTMQGRRSVPPSVVATVMVLQRLEGLSDREAVECYAFDARWRYAAGVGSYDTGGWARFAHTVLVDMRERLRRSDDRDRIFRVGLEAAKEAGVVGRRRVLDSTPLYDGVATMDTVTLIRSALRGLVAAADPGLAAELRAVLSSGDDYASSAKPQIDWDDPAAREALIDSRAKDAFSCLALLDGRELTPPVAEAAALLGAVAGQDLEAGDGGGVRRRRGPPRGVGRPGLWGGRVQEPLGKQRRHPGFKAPPPAAPRRWPLLQEPVRDQPRRRHRHLPRPGHRDHPPPHRRRRHRPLRRRLRHLLAAEPVHQRRRWPHHPGHRPRRRPGPSPPAPSRPGLAGGLPSHPPPSRTQTRPSHATQTRRAPRPDS